MLLFMLATLIYLLIGGLVILIFRDNPIALLMDMLSSIPSGLNGFLAVGWWVVPIFLIFAVMVDRKLLVARLSNTIVTAFTCTSFFTMFTMLKSTLPFIIPFWADPFMVDLDRILHFGVDPWRLAHVFSNWIDTGVIGSIYYNSWLLPAMYLPVLMAMFDADQVRFKRFITLYLVAWVGLGNVFALTFLSAGPVFYDRLYDASYFVVMMEALEQTRITTGGIGGLMDLLWTSYESGDPKVGSGISAFPSVHVGMATVVGLYLYERHRLFLPVTLLIVATYQFLSVYQGWHYAVDGYFSIALVVSVWAYLRRRAARANPVQSAESRQSLAT